MSPEGSPSPAAALHAQPDDVTLVKEILRPWVVSGVNQTGSGAYVHVADVYSAEPEALAGRFAATVSIDCDRMWYFLNPVRAQGGGKRKMRTVFEGDGWWQGEAGPKDILDPVDGDRLIGSRRTFSFMRKTAAGAEFRVGWTMVEFYLQQYDDGGAGRRIDSLVLAKLYRSKRRRNPAVAPDHDAEGPRASLPMEAAASAGKNKAAGTKNASAGKNKAAGTKNPEASGGAAAATASLLAEAAAASNKNRKGPEDAPLLHNKAAHARASLPAEAAASRTKNPEGDNGAGNNEKTVEDSSTLPPARKKLASAAGKIAGAPKKLADAMGKVACAPAAATQLHCPKCGFHIGALQLISTAPAPPGEG